MYSVILNLSWIPTFLEAYLYGKVSQTFYDGNGEKHAIARFVIISFFFIVYSTLTLVTLPDHTHWLYACGASRAWEPCQLKCLTNVCSETPTMQPWIIKNVLNVKF